MRKISLFLSILIGFVLASCSNFVNDLNKLTNVADYTVKYHFEAVDFEGYDAALEKSVTFKGKVGVKTAFTVPEIEGFEVVKSIEHQIIKADGSTKVDVYFDRKNVTITFYPNGGLLDLKYDDDNPYVLKGKYGVTIERPQDPTRIVNNPDYISWNFIGWMPGVNPAADTDTVSLPITFPEENLSYTAKWSKSLKEVVPFTIVEKRQNADGATYLETTTTSGGIPGEYTNVVAEEIPGFETPTVVNAIIEADESDPDNIKFPTVVTVEYKRKTININLEIGEGEWPTETPPVVLQGRYGSKVPAIENPVRDNGWGFSGWNEEGGVLPLTFPTEDITCTAIWVKPYSEYKVEHWLEKVTSTDEEDFEANYEHSAEIEDDILIGSVSSATNAQAKVITGFTPVKIEEKTLTETDDTVVRIFYARKTVTVTVNPNGGKWNNGEDEGEAITVSGKYGTPVSGLESLTNPTKEFWEFLGWNEEGKMVLPATYPEQNKVYTAVWKQTGAMYSVEYLFEKVTSTNEEDFENNYESDPEYASKTLAGKIGELTATEENPVITGFELKTTSNVTITADGSAVARVYYKRIRTTVIYNPNGGKWQDGNYSDTSRVFTITGKYGESIQRQFNNAPKKEFYEFLGWTVEYADNSPSEVVPNGSYKFGLCDRTYTATWKSIGARVAVHFWQEDLDGNYNAGYVNGTGYNDSLTQKDFIVEPGKTTSLTPDISGEEFIGYEIADIQQVNIPSEPDNAVEYIIKVKLARKIISYSFAPAGGTWLNAWSGHGSAPAIKSGKYGTSVDIPVEEDLFRADYEFLGWNEGETEKVTIPETYGISNRTFTAQWKYTGTKYKAQCWFKKLDGTGYEQNLTDWPDREETGSSLDKLMVSPPSIAGFNYVSYDGLLEGDMIKTDGTTVLKLYFDRMEIKYAFYANGGKFADGKSYFELKGLYGSAVDTSTLSNPTKEGYDKFLGWKIEEQKNAVIPETFGPQNITFTADWYIVPVTVITGVGIYTNKDMEMEATVLGTTATVTVTVPYDGEWIFDVRDNNVSITGENYSKTKTGNKVVFTFELPAGSGRHKLEVYATEVGTNSEKSKFKTVDVE